MFKPGDIVVGTANNGYVITGAGVECIVVEHYNNDYNGLTVRVPSRIRPYEEFKVDPYLFSLVKSGAVDICSKVAFMAKRFNERNV